MLALDDAALARLRIHATAMPVHARSAWLKRLASLAAHALAASLAASRVARLERVCGFRCSRSNKMKVLRMSRARLTTSSLWDAVVVC
jgi:hypothetical protein